MAAGSSSGGGSEGIKAGRAYVEIGAKDAGLKAGLESAKKAVLRFGKELAEGGGMVLGLGAAVVGPILASLKEVTEHFSAINRASIKTGASTEAISDLGYAAKLSGAGLEDVESGLKFLDKTMAEAASGSASATEALAQFGLTAAALKGMDADQKMLAISKGLQGIEESAQGPALRSLMGRGALGLKPMLDNSRELARLLKENGEVGGRVSKEDAENAERVEKAYLKVSAAVKNAFMAIGAAILPEAEAIGHFASMATEAARQIKEFIDDNRDAVLAVLGVGAAVAGVGAALVGLGLAASVAGLALGGLVSLASAAATALGLLFSPVGLAVAAGIVAAIVGIAAALETFPNEINAAADTAGKAWGFLSDTFTSSWQGIKNALASGDLKLAFEIAVDALDVVWKGFLLVLTNAWNEFKGVFVDGWHDALTEVKVAIVEAMNFARDQLGESKLGRAVGGAISMAVPGLGAAVGDLAGMTPEQIRAKAEEEAAARKAARALDAVGAAGDLAAAELKRRLGIEKAKPPPVEAGPMPREVARKAAVEGLGAARGQFGGAGAGYALATSGEAIAKDQLDVQKQIEKNTREGGGIRGY